MKLNKKFIRGISSICTAVTVLVSCLLTSVTAAEVNGNELLNVNDYAKFTSSADNTKVIADLTFPAEWTRTHVFWNHVGDTYGSPDLMETGNDINIHNESTDGKFSLTMYPFSKYINSGDQVGRVVTNAKIMDLRYLPSGSSFTYGFEVKITNPLTNVEEFTHNVTEHILYLDENGKVLVHERNYIADPPDFYVDGARVIQWGGVLNVHPVEDAVGFIPFFCLKNITCDLDSDITVKYKGLQVNFSMSNLEYESMQNGMIQDTLDNVQNSINDVGNKVDELPDKIGDEFENVVEQEKEHSKQEGNKFVDQVLDKLPDPSQGVLSALGELTSAVGYTGTEAVIPFPAIVVPGIDGLFEDIVIYDGSDFDLGSCVSYIPENILTVIQSLFTIAIVLYCVYELKGIISFIFTLKEKNNG